MLHKYHKTYSVVVFTLTTAWLGLHNKYYIHNFYCGKKFFIMQTGSVIDLEDIVVKTVCKIFCWTS